MSNHTTTSTITINAPTARVWEALTKPELVKQWQYGADVITDWQKGSPIAICIHQEYHKLPALRAMKGNRNEVERQRLEPSWPESYQSSAGETLLC